MGENMNLFNTARQLLGLEVSEENFDNAVSGETPASVVQWFTERRKHKVKNVAWDLIIQDMYSDINPREILLRTVYDGDPTNVWVTVKLDECPQILNCSEGSMIRVHGEVRSAKGEDIYLEEGCQVEFLE